MLYFVTLKQFKFVNSYSFFFLALTVLFVRAIYYLKKNYVDFNAHCFQYLFHLFLPKTEQKCDQNKWQIFSVWSVSGLAAFIFPDFPGTHL